ncbi:PucR family transcriptional regulator [Amycolatopsis azurea]|uniref:PucR family transcriptional regulator n=1 Tax=Amycolatopsis azurea DSM 43854 TaxID=1238180 RepID=A0ABX3J6W8_9PSEU|nr:PucR family transcriptional regulator ligand-binding domain-containing protein [Amycolatopsis azurea]OOC03401.1 PucR family transcriptional regulator [Amycolatopsis azurea DSM 43854]
MTTVKALLALPGLRLRVRAGTALLDRPVSRVYVTELPNPGRYVSAGELVVSGLLWWRGPGDSEGFVAELVKAGAAALAASGADSDGIPEDLVEACTRHGIPLLEVPTDLSFSVVTERVVLALAAAAEGARKRLLSAATEDASVETLLERARAEIGLPCWVVPAGTPSDLVRRFVAAGGRSLEADDVSVRPVGGRHALPWLLAIGGPLTAAQAEIAEELAGLIGLARTRADEVRAVTDRVLEPLLAALDEGSDPHAALTATGLRGDLRVVVARTEGSEAARGILTELLPPGALVGPAGETTWALAEDDGEWPEDWPATATAALSTVEALLPCRRVLIGVSDRSPVSVLRGAKEVARYALAVATERPGTIEVVPGGEIGMHRLLLAGAPDDLRAALRRRVLGPLLSYDAEQGTDLVHTLRVFLECSGSPTRAARALHVHVNTLRYRIGRASELLGTDLTEFTEQLDVYLALSAGS